MTVPLRVLVTGAGSGVGQGILKSLRICRVPVRLIAADIAPLALGLYVADESVLIPRVESDGALALMIDVLRRQRIDVVMIGSEFDLPFFAAHRETVERETGALVVVSPESTVTIAQDKWLTANFLRERGLPFAESALPESTDEALAIASQWGYPVILKPRVGTSSRYVHLIDGAEALRFFWPRTPSAMLQKMISVPSSELRNEYTCSVFQTAEGDILGPFTARRTLRGGSSWMIEVTAMPSLHSLLLSIAESLPSMGTLNVQLMMGAEGPVPFEFNARFSGTTAVRAHFGFNEPEMALRNFARGERLEQPPIGAGLALRYLEEIFIDDAVPHALVPGPRGTAHGWFRPPDPTAA